MKNKILILLFITAAAFISFNINEEDPLKKNKAVNSDNSSVAVDSKKLDANSISAWYRTNGSFNRDPTTSNAGFEWPKGSGKTARYTAGIWLGCISGNDTLTAVAEYSYDYLPGYVDNFGIPQTDSTYRIYVINKNEINSYDYLHWPGNQGAYRTTEGKPYLMGDQTMFYVYTDGFPHASGSTSDSSLKAQILQTNWVYKPNEYYNSYPGDPFNNTIFMEYRIINKSDRTWNNMFVGLFADDDLGNATDDKVGCDTNLHIGYTYNATNNEGIYGIAPPAVGLKFVRGSLKYTGNLNDTVKYFQPFGSNRIIRKIGFKDEGLTVFSDPNDFTEPLNNAQTYRVMKGLKRDGGRWVNPVTNDTTNEKFSGDPVTGTGWIISGESDRHSYMSTGPFGNINPGDTITIVVAQIIAKGNSNLNSITQLRNTAKIIQNFYDNNLTPQTIAPSPKISSYAPGDGKIYLTWTDTNQTSSFKNILSGGSYNFQGYNIYQIRSHSNNPSAGDTVLLKTFDQKDGITNIADSIYLPPNEGIFYGVVQKGSDNGINRSFEINKDTIDNYRFVNGTEYKFAVTTYYYDPSGGLYTYPKVNESPKSNIIKVIPQSLSPGTQVSYNTGDTLYTDQNDLAVMPVVNDPMKLVNAVYTSSFGGTYANPNWTITKTYNGITSTLFENIYNFSGTLDSVKSADGLLFDHQLNRDSGIVHDPGDVYSSYYSNASKQDTRQRTWTYDPPGKEWFTAPDTNAIKRFATTTRKLIRYQFQSRSLGMSFPTGGTFRNSSTKIKANAPYFTIANTIYPTLMGGPLRKIKVVFGQSQKAYRYSSISGNILQIDTNLQNTPYANMINIPFQVFAIDGLDSSNGSPRQLNVGFVDSDNDGLWNPDTSELGKYQITYFFATTYDSIPNQMYTEKNPGALGTVTGFGGLDIMYAWLPRVKNINGVPAQWSDGDVLTITPYRITRPDFVPGYPVKYKWEVKGTEFGNKQLASSEVNNIKAFPNPYYGFSSLELNDDGDKFIYFSHLPQSCTIFIYTLDGILVNSIYRNQTNPENTLEKWNLQNEGGSYVASGMYLVYVDCKDLGAKPLKIAVFPR